jgi:predicted transcriptional regulator
MSNNITIRIPEELKGRMERCKNVNWSEVARKAFEDAARREEIQCAADSIKKLRVETEEGWDGAKEIRKWRDAAK